METLREESGPLLEGLPSLPEDALQVRVSFEPMVASEGRQSQQGE